MVLGRRVMSGMRWGCLPAGSWGRVGGLGSCRVFQGGQIDSAASGGCRASDEALLVSPQANSERERNGQRTYPQERRERAKVLESDNPPRS